MPYATGTSLAVEIEKQVGLNLKEAGAKQQLSVFKINIKRCLDMQNVFGYEFLIHLCKHKNQNQSGT